MDTSSNRRRLMAAGTLLGIGMGGFVDGILFHQILQIHAMLSNRVPKTSVANIEINMFWGGLFHAATWTLTAVGLGLLWRAVKRREVPLSGRSLLRSMFFGWGMFNLVEGLIDHQILQIHHVMQNGNHVLWDMVFLGSGVVFAAAGWMMIGFATDRNVAGQNA